MAAQADRFRTGTTNVIPLRPLDPEPAETPRKRRSWGTVRRLPRGRWQASYLADGVRHFAPVAFFTKTDAGAWLDMRHAELLEHRWKPEAQADRGAIPFDTYATKWLAERELKPRTRAEYRKTLDNHLVPAFGQQFVRAITADEVRDWYRSMDPNLKTARTHAYALLRTILGTAASEGDIPANPCHIVGAGSTKRVRKIRPATLDELATLIEHMPERYGAMVLLSSWTALRFGELTELRRRDLDLGAGVVRVTRAVTWPNGLPVVGTPKSDAGVRDVFIPPHILPALRSHVDRFAQPGPEGLLFPNTEGKHMHHGSLYKVFKPARLAAGRPDLTWHGLRHTGATMAAQQGATLAELMDRLGHSTVNAALRYQHAASDRQAELARRLSAMAEGQR